MPGRWNAELQLRSPNFPFWAGLLLRLAVEKILSQKRENVRSAAPCQGKGELKIIQKGGFTFLRYPNFLRGGTSKSEEQTKAALREPPAGSMYSTEEGQALQPSHQTVLPEETPDKAPASSLTEPTLIRLWHPASPDWPVNRIYESKRSFVSRERY